MRKKYLKKIKICHKKLNNLNQYFQVISLPYFFNSKVKLKILKVPLIFNKPKKVLKRLQKCLAAVKSCPFSLYL